MSRVFIDKRILERFKKRALKVYPVEYIEEVWGRVKTDGIHVFYLGEMEQIADRGSIEYDYSGFECGEKDGSLQMLGTLHTHPHPCDESTPSRTDTRNSREEKEIVMGIMAIRKTPHRSFASTSFYTAKSKPRKKLELFIAD